MEVFIRFSVAFFSGSLLSLSGSLIQALTQNPLAGPSTLGINAFAVLSALLCFIMGLWIPIETLDWLNLFIILLVSAALILFVKFKFKDSKIFLPRSATPMNKILLIGLCFNLFVGSLFSLLQFLSMAFHWEFPDYLWYGNFRFSSQTMALALLILFVLNTFLSWQMAQRMRLLSFGPQIYGPSHPQYKNDLQRIFWISMSGVGAVVSFFGVFAFFGLLAPHLLRAIPLFRYRTDYEVLYGPVLSGLGFALIDYACYRWVLMGAEIPAGLVISLLGTGALALILIKNR